MSPSEGPRAPGCPALPPPVICRLGLCCARAPGPLLCARGGGTLILGLIKRWQNWASGSIREGKGEGSENILPGSTNFCSGPRV